MIDNLAIFIFKESQNTIFLCFDTPIIIEISIAVARISITNLDDRKLSHVVLLPLPVLYIWIVRLSKGCSCGLEDRITVSLTNSIGIGLSWFGIQGCDQLCSVCKLLGQCMHVKSTNDAL